MVLRFWIRWKRPSRKEMFRRGIDIVVGGHSHTFIDRPGYERDLDGKLVPIVQAGCWGLEMGNMKVLKK